MKEKCERGRDSLPEGKGTTERLIEEAVRSLGWGTPRNVGELGRDESARETDAEWPSLLQEIPEEQPAWTRDFSLAVLPFRVEGHSGEGTVALDIADSLTTRLGEVGLPNVRPASTSLKFNVPQDASKAGSLMNVKYVIDGSVRQTELGLCVRARCLSVFNSEPLWEESYRGDSRDVLGVENSLAEKVALNFRPNLNDELRARLRRRGTASAAAHLKFKQGRHDFNQFSRAGLNSAVTLLEEAIVLDPEFADAYACAGEALLWLFLLGLVEEEADPAELLGRCRRYADEAVRLVPTLANAHATKAFLDLLAAYDWTAAAQGFIRALELDPNCAFAHIGLALIMTSRKMFDEALAEIDRALVIDPTSLICNVVKGLIHFQARAWRASEKQFDHTLVLYRRFWEYSRGTHEAVPPDTIFFGQALAFIGQGRLEDARKAAKKAARYSHGHRVKCVLLAYVYILLGRRREAQKILDQIPEAYKESRIPFHIALTYAALCEKEPVNKEQHAAQAYRYLSLAVENRDYWALWLAADPRLDILRSDRARFGPLLHDARLPPHGIL
jgi:TolB-like protein/thioredoxin-like negative regulator of GroEL